MAWLVSWFSPSLPAQTLTQVEARVLVSLWICRPLPLHIKPGSHHHCRDLVSLVSITGTHPAFQLPSFRQSLHTSASFEDIVCSHVSEEAFLPALLAHQGLGGSDLSGVFVAAGSQTTCFLDSPPFAVYLGNAASLEARAQGPREDSRTREAGPPFWP